MYVSTLSRSLGAAPTITSNLQRRVPLPPVRKPPAPMPITSPPAREACGKQWQAFKAAHPGAAHPWGLFLKSTPQCGSAQHHCAQRWREWKFANSKAGQGWSGFQQFLRGNPSCGAHLNCGENTLPDGSVVMIECVNPLPAHVSQPLVPAGRDTRAARAIRSLSGLGTITACQDAGTGLLINCWNAATEKGLGRTLSQDQLNRLSTAYQRITRPQFLAGWTLNKQGRPVWKGLRGLGADIYDPVSGTYVPDDSTSPDPIIVQTDPVPPSPLSIPSGPLPAIISNYKPALPTVTPQTLLAAAALPNAPAIVKQAAAQLPPGSASMFPGFSTAWFTQSMIAGIPNWGLLAGGALLMVLVAGKRRRR